MTRKVCRRSAVNSRTALRIESLEARQMLAFAAFESTLLRDDDGSPGEVIADNSLVVGESFFLQITAQEFDPGRYGLQSVGLDVEWDAALLDVVEDDFSLSSVLTENLPAFQKGELNQADGTVEGLSGTAGRALGLGRAIGNAMPETFALIRMRASDQVGLANLSLKFGDEPIITAPYALLGPRHITLDSEAISIRAASEESVPDPAIAEVIAPPTEVVETVASDVTPIDTPSDSVEEPGIVVRQAESLVIPVAVDARAIHTAPVIEEVVSFDMNQDGVFDFADFGLMNIQADLASAATEPIDPQAERTPDMIPEAVSEEPVEQPETESVAILHTCLAFPDSTDVEATEEWLDAFAAAWIADSEARQRRRRI